MHSFVVILFVDDVNLEQYCMRWLYNDVQLQRVASRFCGHYCILRSRYINVRSIVISFNRNTGLAMCSFVDLYAIKETRKCIYVFVIFISNERIRRDN